jgi:hypothetical protein
MFFWVRNENSAVETGVGTLKKDKEAGIRTATRGYSNKRKNLKRLKRGVKLRKQNVLICKPTRQTRKAVRGN